MFKQRIRIAAIISLIVICLGAAACKAGKPAPGPTPDKALKMLQDGNLRFADGKSQHPRAERGRLASTAANGQHPFATILSCSDSRVPPEIIFDQGVGDVFSVRVAGNVADTNEIGSIEYGAEHIHTPLLLVLGHTACGAVTAAATDAALPPNIAAVVANIKPAVQAVAQAHQDLHGKDLVPFAVTENVWQAIADIYRRSSIVRELAHGGRLMVVGAVYDISTGKVAWLGKHPHEAQLLGAEPAAPSASKGVSQSPKPAATEK